MIILITGTPASAMTLSAPRKPCNSAAWIAIADFLDAQHLSFFGLRRLSAAETRARRAGSPLPLLALGRL